VKLGAPVIDYATGMTGAFALSAALFQREKTGAIERLLEACVRKPVPMPRRLSALSVPDERL
jgi:crotonobetainyl-CoA:carnitine CoA-transferase CaiB-like acyl-CoA transferase